MALPRHIYQPRGKRKHLDDHDQEEEDVKPVISDSDDSDLDDDSEGDSDVGGGEGTGVVEYYEHAEPLPNCVAYDSEFRQLSQDLIDIPLSALKILQKSSCNNKRVQSCQHNAGTLTTIPQVQKEKVAMLGSTGAGKSSLLNSLLDMPGLAKAMAAGQSCTYVGTEYESPFPDQTKAFAAQVEYFDIDRIRDLLSRLLVDYNTFNFQLPEDCDQDEKQELSRLSKTAFSTFRSLFCDRAEFESPRAAQEHLETLFREDEDNGLEALDLMVEWCEDLLEEDEDVEGGHIQSLYLEADTQDELLEQLEPLVSSTSRYEDPALWPLVRKVRVGLERPRILKHITLVDLPGLDDINKIRVDTSIEIMRDCDTIWVVTKIDRAITETMVDSLVMRFGKSYKMMIICTGIDDNIDDKGLAEHLVDEGQSIGDHETLLVREKELFKRVRGLARKIMTRKDKLEGHTAAKKKAKRPLTETTKEKLRGDILQLQEKLKATEQEHRDVAQQRFELLVDARNANAMRRLKAEKTDQLTPGTTLEVFCVSNLHYLALKGAKTINGPRLDAEATGVPALRAYILKSAAPAQFAALENYIGHKFTTFMKGLAMWARSYSVQGAAQLLKAVKKPQGMAQDIVNNYVEELTNASTALVIAPLMAAQQDLIKGAFEVLDEKQKWHWSTMRAFIRRDGTHRTSVVPKQCWNEQFLEAANKLNRQNLGHLTQEKDKLGVKMKTQLSDLVRTIAAVVKNDPASTVLPMDRLNEIFEAQFAGIQQAYNEHHQVLKKGLRNIELDLMQDRHGAYFTEAMSSLYEKCKNDSGTGVKKRVLDAFQETLNPKPCDDKSPFATMCVKFKAAIAREAKSKSKPLARKNEDILREIYRQFDDMLDEKIDDKEEDKLRKEFRAFLDEMEPKFESIKERLAALKAGYAAKQRLANE
ncbi:hypothetical protein Tdes44962_MAKER01237 [Teratosphaeria destructans]|uniref:DUF7605 domain-containing protein n=1 Tax=Teratosphaeria destructans TaxID=418781 RepID=A0A9W7T0W3_9PEZI|nr:hypothetical protein Tdes44962_MAKER01237 [Teratosphaeria destructans]